MLSLQFFTSFTRQCVEAEYDLVRSALEKEAQLASAKESLTLITADRDRLRCELENLLVRIKMKTFN